MKISRSGYYKWLKTKDVLNSNESVKDAILGDLALLNSRLTPQQARQSLPLNTKTTLVHTAFESDWKHFFDLRVLGTTGAPHPNMKKVAEIAYNKVQHG